MKKITFLFGLILLLSLSIGCCNKIILSSPEQYIAPTGMVRHLKSTSIELMEESGSGEYKTVCSGVWINGTDILLANHCIQDSNNESTIGDEFKFRTFKEGSINFPDNVDERFLSTAVLLAYNAEKDLAVLRSLNDVDHDVSYIRRFSVEDGSKLFIVGHPSGMTYTFIDGIVSASRVMNIHLNNDKFIEARVLHITALIWFGNSGGGAFLPNGELIGIASFMYKVPGMGFFIDAFEIRDFLSKNEVLYYMMP